MCVCVCVWERFTDSSLWCPIKHDTLFLSFPRKPSWTHAAVRHVHLNIPSELSSNLLTIFHFFVFHVLTHTLLFFPSFPPAWPRFLAWWGLARLCCYHQRICIWKLVFGVEKKLDIFPALQLPVNLTDGMCVLGPPSPLFFCSQLKMPLFWQFVLLKAMEKTLWSSPNNDDSRYCISRWTLSTTLL